MGRLPYSAPMRPFRFLAAVQEVVDGRPLAELARRAESMGYDGVVIPDHLMDQLSPVPAMAVIAAATERLRVGTFVFNNDLRHPAVLAQDLASLDVLSGGRLEIGIGAGWNKPEYDAIGLSFDPGGVRVARLEESIAVLKGLFADGPFSFRGEHYTITEMDGRPKPVQRPHPPFLVGGGRRRVLTLAGREADIVGLAPRTVPGGVARDPRSITVEATREKIDWVREGAGDRFGALELNSYPTMGASVITDDARGEARKVLDRLREGSGIEISEEDVLASPHVFIGSVEGLVEKLRGLREELGISCFMTGDIDALAPVVERLAGT